MTTGLRLRSRSVKAKLILGYLLTLGVGGLVASLGASWIVSATIMDQARRKVDHDLVTARTLYEQELATLKSTVRLAAHGTTMQEYLEARDTDALLAYLDPIRADNRFDFLTLTDGEGRVLLRTTRPGRRMDDVSSISVVRAALLGEVAGATEILTAERLTEEDPRLAERARFDLVPTPHAKPTDEREETSGMVLIAAAPLRRSGGEVLGVLYAGLLLSRNLELVDHVWELIYKGERFRGQDIGTVTIFQKDLRVATNVKTADGGRALGTRVSREVNAAVLDRGETWRWRAFVVNDWYISSYEPIRNHAGEIVGILYVGLLEKAYTSIRDRIVLTFLGIGAICLILAAAITYRLVDRITHPIREMVAATRSIAAGEFDQELRTGSEDEIGRLAESFNSMFESLRRMRRDLEEWGRTLEAKVQQRTEEVVAMQRLVSQSERLASMGRLAAGVAHEVNNPLGGILSLTALTLEEMPSDDPNRENLEEVIRQTERCRDIVKGLLGFSHQEETRRQPIDVNDVLSRTLALVEKQAMFLNVEVVKEWGTGLPWVVGDGSQLEQVFMNVILNAAQAMDEKGTLRVATRRSARGDLVEVMIGDTGRGIAPEVIDRIWDPFFTTKTGGGGTGLGLSIAYGIVTRHRGSISAQSELGRGSTFTIRLPVAAVAGEEGTGPLETPSLDSGAKMEAGSELSLPSPRERTGTPETGGV